MNIANMTDRTTMKLIHAFYSLTPNQQRLFQLKLAGLFIVFNLLVGFGLYWLGFWMLIPLVVGFSLSVFAPFVDVPGGVKAGSLIYYSPLLIGEKVKNQRLVLHGGSLFDYYFVLDRTANAQQRRKSIYAS